MREPGDGLRLAAFAVHAKQVRAALFHRRTARRTVCGRQDLPFARFRVTDAAHNLGDDVVAAADPYLAAEGQLLALDVAVVIKRRVLHSDAADVRRREARKWGQLARAPQLPGNGQQRCDILLGCELIRNRPAGEAVGVSHHLACAKIRDLDYRAVDQKIKRFPLCFHRIHGLFQRLG